MLLVCFFKRVPKAARYLGSPRYKGLGLRRNFPFGLGKSSPYCYLGPST